MMGYTINIIFLTVFVLFPHRASGNGTELINYTLNLLTEGDKYIDAVSYADIFLILGKTGTGKSTLAQLIAGNNSRLISKDIGNEYIIEDLDERISIDNTITSQTLFPELIYDQESNTTYCDCPGFSDTRNSSVDIGATYFIHKVIDAAKRVKAMFVVNYSAVREGVDRNDFMNLLLHATNLFKNIENFNNSIVLVATKIDNIYNKNGKLLTSDDQVIANIAGFLNKVKLSIGDILAEKPNSKRIYYENAIKMIDIFLMQINGNYINIGIFRRPDEPGLISESSLMQENRMKLKDMMEFSIQYAPVGPNDFGYTISDESRNDINDLVEEINKVITDEIVKATEVIPKEFELREKSIKDLGLFKEEVSTNYTKLMNLIANLENLKQPKDIATKLGEFLAYEKISNSYQNMENIKKYDNFLRFLELVSSKTLPTKTNDLIAPLINIAKDVLITKNIYTLFNDLFLTLSSYDVQKNPERFSTTKLRDEISVLKKTNSPMHGTRLTEYLKGFYSEDISNGLTIPGFVETNNSQISTTKLQILNDILDYTLTNKITFTCDSTLTVYGTYVKVTDIQKITCSNWRILQVFATNKFFVDNNYEVTDPSGEVKIVVIAPVWEIINNQKIVLRGQDGLSHSINKAADGLNAPEGELSGITGGTGENGLIGLPGQPGGSLLGISEKFVNSEGLVVSSIGGNGGSGQNGGNGGKGSDGKTADYTFTRDDKVITLFYNVVISKYNRHSGFGGMGGKGGDSGRGGLPGAGSEIKIFALSDNSTIPEIKIINGIQGASGNVGIGGSGGLGGLFCSKENAMKFVGPLPVVLGDRNEICDPQNKANSGSDGSGVHAYGPEEPKQLFGIDNKQDFVLTYKNYLQANSNNRMPKSTSNTFFRNLDNIRF